MDLQNYKQRLLEVKKQLDNKEIDEIPLDARPKMLDFDFDKDSYVIVSYSRKDFVEVYLFLAYLYNEGYRFWYDNGMKGTEKWLEEYKAKFENPNCLGTITFFSDNYISNSTKEELEIIYDENGYVKKNVMVSLISLKDLDSNQILIGAMSKGRITIPNANTILPVLSEIIAEEKEKTIHRYMGESDIQPLTEKIGNDFNIRVAKEDTAKSSDFIIYGDKLLAYTGNDSTVIIPDGIFEIGPEAFDRCKSLTSVIMPDSVGRIGDRAFRRCHSLTNVKLSKNLDIIGREAFVHCVSLEHIELPDSVWVIETAAFEACYSLTSVVIPSNVDEIEDYVFSGCTSLSSVIISNGVKKFGYRPFNCCFPLRRQIRFEGTKDQWKQIKKVDPREVVDPRGLVDPRDEGEKYDLYDVNKIKCIDGDIEDYL